MTNAKNQDIFKIIRLGIALDDIDDNILKKHLLDLNEYKQTLLHVAIAHKQPNYALFLIEKGVNVNQQDYTGATALHFAAYYKMPTVALSILQHNGDPNATDENGNGPLWTATLNARGNYSVVEILRKFDANPDMRNIYGKSPLDIAKQIKDEKLVNVLTS